MAAEDQPTAPVPATEPVAGEPHPEAVREGERLVSDENNSQVEPDGAVPAAGRDRTIQLGDEPDAEAPDLEDHHARALYHLEQADRHPTRVGVEVAKAQVHAQLAIADAITEATS